MDRAAQGDDEQAFAALVHRLASPLGAIANYAYLLPQEGDTASRDGILAAIASARGTLRDAQRWIDAMETATVRPPEAGVDLVVAFRSLSEEPSARISLDAPEAVRVALPEAAAVRLAEALVRTAVARGAEQLRLEGERSGRVTVTLQGATWSPEEADRAFALFPPVDSESNDAAGELALAGSLVHRLGGRAWGSVGTEGGVVLHLRLPAVTGGGASDPEEQARP